MGEKPAKAIRHPSSNGPSPAMIEDLRRRIAQVENSRRPSSGAVVSSGCGAFDRLLPDGGFRRGSLVEWLADQEGSGVETLALLLAREACRDGGALVIVDRARQFYPPAAAHLGIEPACLVVAQPASAADELWALDQSLRCSGVAAATAWLERLESHDFRRLQLAAESHRALGLLLRPAAVRGEPSWAEVRLEVKPLPSLESTGSRRLQVDLLRSRRGIGRGTVELEINEQAFPVHLVARLARAAANPRAARA